MQREVSAEHVAAHFLELLEEVAQTRGEIVIVRDGKPLAKMMAVTESAPVDFESRERALEKLRGDGVKILGDIVEPIDW